MSTARRITDAAFNMIAADEGCRLAAYQDTGGVWTIGYGHTAAVHHGTTCTQAQADAWLWDDISGAEATVSAAVAVPLNDNQFSALVSFTYNVGSAALRDSTLLRLLNSGDYDAVPGQLARWNECRGRVLAGLTRRRGQEAALWNEACAPSASS